VAELLGLQVETARQQAILLESQLPELPHRLVHLVQSSEADSSRKARAAVEFVQIQHHWWRMVFHFFIASVGNAYNEGEISLLSKKNIKKDNGCYQSGSALIVYLHSIARIDNFCIGEKESGLRQAFGVPKEPRAEMLRKQQLNLLISADANEVEGSFGAGKRSFFGQSWPNSSMWFAETTISMAFIVDVAPKKC